jgi:uncharacterized protein
MASLNDFMISRVRGKLYKIFYSRPQEMYYVRQLTRMTEEEINAVRRELKRMDKTGVIKKEQRGNRLYYFINPQYDFLEDMLSLVAKTTGLGLSLRKNRNKLGKIKFAMLSGKYVRQLNRESNEVDLLIVGNVVLPELSILIQKEEQDRQDEINYTVMTPDEFEFRKNRRDPFLQQILANSRIMLIGDQQGLVERQEVEAA